MPIAIPHLSRPNPKTVPAPVCNGLFDGGTATAASLWNTGAIGVAAAFHRYEIATVLSLLNFLTLQFVTQMKRGDSSPD